MFFLPAGRTGLAVVDAAVAEARDTASEKVKGKRRAVDADVRAEGGPVERYLPVMNACLAVLILVLGLLGRAGGEVDGGLGMVRLSMLPALALAVVVGVKVMLGSVDVEELEGLRYGYKGA
jgi:hypothetical protein